MALTLTGTATGTNRGIILNVGGIPGTYGMLNFHQGRRDQLLDSLFIGGTTGNFGTALTYSGTAAVNDAYGYLFPDYSRYNCTYEYDIGTVLQPKVTSPTIGLWVNPTLRFDALSVKLQSMLQNEVMAFNSAWQVFAAGFGTTAGTIDTADIVIGDRRAPKENGVTICIVNPSENASLQDVALGDFGEVAYRTIRCYIDLQEKNETDSRETEQERLRDILRSAIYDMLMDRVYQQITDANGWLYHQCHPTSCETGEVLKQKKWIRSFEINWEAATQGTR
jgi:hypothetical protein